MKQCPNPNCILYTRLEELPDAYVRCPGCGGALVDASLTTSSMTSSLFTRTSLSSSMLGAYQDYQTHGEYADGPSPALTYPQTYEAAPPESQPVYGSYAYGGAYGGADGGHYEPQAPVPPDAHADPTSPRRLGFGRLALLGTALLLATICLSASIVIVSRLMLRAGGGTAAGPHTVRTVQAFNTPVALPSEGAAPTPTPALSGGAPESPQAGHGEEAQPPTQSQAQPQPQPQSQAPAQQTPPTPPPAQTEPTGGVLDARMALELEGGQPAGNVQSYRPTDAFHLAVQARYGPGGVTSITTRWYGPDGHQIYEVRKEFTQAGTYYAGFTLRKTSPWPIGDYRVDIHTNDSPTPDYTLYFSVVP